MKSRDATTIITDKIKELEKERERRLEVLAADRVRVAQGEIALSSIEAEIAALEAHLIIHVPTVG